MKLTTNQWTGIAFALAGVACCCASSAFAGLIWFCMVFFSGPNQAKGAEMTTLVQGSCWVPARSLPGPETPRSSPAYRWQPVPDEDEQVALYDGLRYIGNYSYRWDCFRPIINNGWGDPCRPPIKPPERVVIPQAVPTFQPGSLDVELHQDEEQLAAPVAMFVAVAGDELPTGVDMDKVGKGPEYSICDDGICHPISRTQAIVAIENGVPDDSGKLRLTIIGSQADRKRVEADLSSPDFRELRDRLRLWSVEPTHWSVADAGFVTTGKPTIYLQSPQGKVIGREDVYEGRPTLEAIRKRVDGYDPTKDLTIKIQPVFKVDLPLVHIGTLAALAGVAGVLAIRKGRP